MACYNNYVKCVTEPGAAQGVHRDPGTHRVHHARLLEDGVAGEGELYCHGHQDI